MRGLPIPDGMQKLLLKMIGPAHVQMFFEQIVTEMSDCFVVSAKKRDDIQVTEFYRKGKKILVKCHLFDDKIDEDSSYSSSIRRVCEAWTESLLGKSDALCPIEDNSYSIATSLALEKSCNENKKVSFRKFLEDAGIANILERLR